MTTSGFKAIAYLISWKAGIVTHVSDLYKSGVVPDSGKSPKLRGLSDKPRNRTLKPVAINSSLIALIGDTENSLEICKLEIASPDPCLRTLCLLELPSLAPGTYIISSARTGWVPTSTSYARSRSSRGYHLPFCSSTIGMIVLRIGYCLPGRANCSYAITINVKGLLSAIRTDVRHVPWVDWGPSSTDVFKIGPTTRLIPVGPFLIKDPLSLAIRHYDLWRTTQSTAEDISSLQSRSPTLISAAVFQYNVETHLPYRDFVIDKMNLFDYAHIVVDREWVVRVEFSVCGFCVSND